MTEKPINTFIVDDEKNATDMLVSLLQDYFPKVRVVGTADSIKSAYEGIQSHKPDLVFLDINLGSQLSFELLELFDKIDFQIIFLTAYEQYAIQAIKVSALDYVLKPVNIGKLKEAITRYNEQLESNITMKVGQMISNISTDDLNQHKIALPVQSGTEFKRIDDILYLMADGSYTRFHFRDKTQIVVSKHLKLYNDVLIDYGFYRIHNSVLINLKYVRKIGKSHGGYVIMEDGNELSISKSRKDGFLTVFHSTILN
jgi:two-component system LytT family response regulator